MSSEPTSSAHVFLQAQAKSPRPEPLAALYEREPEPPYAPPARPSKRRSFTVRVEPKKQRRTQPTPRRDLNSVRWSDMTPAEMASFRIYPKDQP